jgi:CheY-like chemotaxis protein
MKNARVLVLEDDPLWQDTLRDVLEGQVAWLKAAATLAEALEALDHCYFNLAIVDISLKAGDPKDSQGMAFLQGLYARGLQDAVRCIVLTAYADVARVREAFHDYKVVDVMEKVPFTAQALTAKVDEALTANHLKHEVEIEIAQRRSLTDLFAGLQWAEREPAQELHAEAQDLLLRLLSGATHLFIDPLQTGQSGAMVARVEPSYGARAGTPVVLKCGKREKIQRESVNYEEFVERYVGGHCTTRLRHVTGRVMGAIAYQLIGTEVDEAVSFAVYYRQRATPDITHALDHLFEETCARCYENLEPPRRNRDLVALYEQGLHLQWDEVWQGATAAGVDLAADLVTIPSLPGAFTNPQRWLATRNYTLHQRCWLAPTHGDLNEHNLLVTAGGQCWLIDFYRTGQGHVLRDLVELETALKFSLSAASLAEHMQIENLLLSQERLDAPPLLPRGHPHAKLLSVIAHLRGQAARLVGADRDMAEYNTALLLTTLNLLRLPALRHSHDRVLLSAALLCDRLA